MSSPNQSGHNLPEPAPIGCSGLIVRMLWLMAGNLALFVLSFFIFQKHAFSFIDVVFWAIVVGLIIIRRIDITRLNGLTSNSEPATVIHWRLYVIKLLAVSAVLWGLAHGIPYLTNR